MREYVNEQRTITARKCTRQTCDLCGCEAVQPGSRWEGGLYDVSETRLEVSVVAEEGTVYPEGGSTERTVVDLCPTCFNERLVPWLRSQGAKISEPQEIER